VGLIGRSQGQHEAMSEQQESRNERTASLSFCPAQSAVSYHYTRRQLEPIYAMLITPVIFHARYATRPPSPVSTPVHVAIQRRPFFDNDRMNVTVRGTRPELYRTHAFFSIAPELFNARQKVFPDALRPQR